MTVIELLVVIVIISVLAASVLVAASAVVDRAQVTNTRAVLQLVSDAVDEWQREQKAKPRAGLLSAKQGSPPATYVSRYGEYPPDELEVFTNLGIPGAPTGSGTNSLAPGKAVATVPTKQPPFSAMHFHPDLDPSRVADNALEHRDQAALILAIESYGEASAKILSDIPAKNRTAGPLDANGAPMLFLDRPPSANVPPNGTWDPDLDGQIRFITDAWGVPIGYFAVRDWIPNEPANIANQRKSSNHPAWCEASSWFVRANKGRPLIFSYGPNGKDQLTEELMDSAGNPAAVSLVGDYNDTINGRGKVDHPLNQDNVYLDSDLTRKLLEGPKKIAPATTR